MNQDTSRPDNINQSGNFVVGVNKGSFKQNAPIYQSNVNNEDSLEKTIDQICQELAQKYSSASEAEKQIILKAEIRNKLDNTPQLKKRFISALKAGSAELIKVFTNNPFVSVSLETVKGWFEGSKN
jgi:hypothetical protein